MYANVMMDKICQRLKVRRHLGALSVGVYVFLMKREFKSTNAVLQSLERWWRWGLLHVELQKGFSHRELRTSPDPQSPQQSGGKLLGHLRRGAGGRALGPGRVSAAPREDVCGAAPGQPARRGAARFGSHPGICHRPDFTENPPELVAPAPEFSELRKRHSIASPELNTFSF